MNDLDRCVACRKTLGHRPRDCEGTVRRAVRLRAGSLRDCECRCRTEAVPLDITGFYWPLRHAGGGRPTGKRVMVDGPHGRYVPLR